MASNQRECKPNGSSSPPDVLYAGTSPNVRLETTESATMNDATRQSIRKLSQ